MKLANCIDSAARMLVAIYVAILLFGPTPLGFLPLLFPDWPLMAAAQARSIDAGIIVSLLVIPWLVAGFLAGRRLGFWAGMMGFLLLAINTLAYGRYNTPLVDLLLLFLLMILAGAIGWLGGQVSSRFAKSDVLSGQRGWRIGAMAVSLLLLYQFTVGRSVAARRLGPGVVSRDSNSHGVHCCGAYLGSGPDEGADIVYVDPTGLIRLGSY